MAENLEQQDALLVNLVLIFQNAAMQQMGKITNPMTGEVEKNLEQARFSIDVIDMLRSKTRGNLSADLEKLLDTTLTNLRMNYVDEANKEASGEDGVKGDETPPAGESKDDARPGGEETPPKGESEDDARPGGEETPPKGESEDAVRPESEETAAGDKEA